MIKVIIVDDHPVVIDGIRQLLAAQSDIETVGVALCGADCLTLLRERVTDVVLLDINLPDTDGIELCKTIHEYYPFLKIIALTGFTEYSYIRRMLQYGAQGYLLKNALPGEIMEGIRQVYAGEKYLCEDAERIVRDRCGQGKLFLTPRETELLRLVVEGYTNREIADRLFLGVETVNSYRKNLLLKLGVRNTAAMVSLAIREKLV